MQDDFLDEEIKPERSTFLKVLCILTFIGSGWSIASNCYSYFNADKLSQQKGFYVRVKVDSSKIKAGDTAKSKFANKLTNTIAILGKPDNIRKLAIGNFISSVFCILGALLMWRLKKIGFYSYIIGILIGTLLPFYLFGNNFVSVAQSAIVGFFGLLFIIFYAMNLKSMK